MIEFLSEVFHGSISMTMVMIGYDRIILIKSKEWYVDKIDRMNPMLDVVTVKRETKETYITLLYVTVVTFYGEVKLRSKSPSRKTFSKKKERK